MKKYYQFIKEDINQEENNQENTKQNKKLESEKEIKDYIKHKISQEDKNNPISDEKLSQILRASRRTIQNYRQEVGIPPIKSRIDKYKNDNIDPYELVYGKKKEKPQKEESTQTEENIEYIDSLIGLIAKTEKNYSK